MEESKELAIHIDKKKEKALEFILQGWKETDIAEKLGVSRMTLYRWRKYDEYFIEALDERRSMMIEQATNGILELTGKAIEAIRRALTEGDLKTQLQAAKLVLQMAEKAKGESEKDSVMLDLIREATMGIEEELGLKR